MKRQFSINKNILFYLLPPIFLLMGVLAYSFLDNSIDFNELDLPKNIISDSDDNSSVKVINNDKVLFNLTYQVDDILSNPYAGGGFSFDSQFIDLSGFKEMEINLDSYNSNDFRLIITDFIEGFSKKDNSLSHRYFVYDASIKKGKSRYIIQFKDLFTPRWWYTMMKINQSDLRTPKKNFKRVGAILFYNHPLSPKDVNRSLQIHSIRFIKSHRTLWVITLITVSFYILFILIFNYSFRRKREVISHRKLQIPEGEKGRDLKTLLHFINENYDNTDLNLNTISMKTVLSEARIRDLLKKSVGMSLRQYINDIRITETKRLLIESDLQIKEIAFKVGYRHLSSFNRAFSEDMKMSPAEFREKYKSAI